MRLPDFLVIGAAKSGTSSLYHYLNQHPQIFMCPHHEPNFFALEGVALEKDFRGPGDREAIERFCIRDLEQYTASFAEAPPESCVGEISPLYLYSSHAPENIREFCPKTKLIAILRHPADRAFSNFQQYRKADIEQLPTFAQALDAERSGLRAGWGPWPFWHYQDVGFYGKQLTRYFDRFDRDQILVCLYEDLNQNPYTLFQKIFTFLGVDESFSPNLNVRHNLSAQSKSKTLHRLATQPNPWKGIANLLIPASIRHSLRDTFHRWNTKKERLDAEIRAGLVRLYREDILHLQDLIHMDLSHWLA